MEYDFETGPSDDNPFIANNDTSFPYSNMMDETLNSSQQLFGFQDEEGDLTQNLESQQSYNEPQEHSMNDGQSQPQSKRPSHVMVPVHSNSITSSPSDASQDSSRHASDIMERAPGANDTGAIQTPPPARSNHGNIWPNQTSNDTGFVHRIEGLNLNPNENVTSNYGFDTPSNTFQNDYMDSTVNDGVHSLSDFPIPSTSNSPLDTNQHMFFSPHRTVPKERHNSPNQTNTVDAEADGLFPRHVPADMNSDKAIFTNEVNHNYIQADGQFKAVNNAQYGGSYFKTNNNDKSTLTSVNASGAPHPPAPTSIPDDLPPLLGQREFDDQQPPHQKWKCRMKVQLMQPNNKSRVETQINIRVTVFDPPADVTKVHLPTHTISKPKYVQKTPPWEPHTQHDALELSALVFCTSAMEKPDKKETAFARGESEQVPTLDDVPPSSKKSPDEEDPAKPLNGAPMWICDGCINRERKRHARKKTKTQNEDEEWLKDMKKRVILFNCQEVKECFRPEKKDLPASQQQRQPNELHFDAPLRIACYCRHVDEKTGFRVLYTLRHEGEIIAQALGENIMITDDHKQPVPPLQATNYPSGMPLSIGGNPSYGVVHQANFQNSMPIRTSFSTNDLQQFMPEYNIGMHRPHRSGNVSGSVTTANATPQNLSRPASPSGVEGQPGTKKRRSGGPVQHVRMPSGLAMTPAENRRNPLGNKRHSGGAAGTAPASATNFSFSSPTSANFSSPMDQSLPQNQHLRQLQSGPPTPLNGQPFSFNSAQMSSESHPFYSAPTSQHQSRAHSPNGAARMHQADRADVPGATAMALDRVPEGINVQNPPMIERVHPGQGTCSGNETITILGRGFIQGLEVMFGDSVALTETLWKDSALVVRAPARSSPGKVSVMFKHQHPRHATSQLATLMPSEQVSFEYFDEGGDSGTGTNAIGGGSSSQTFGSPFTPHLQPNSTVLAYRNHHRHPSGGHFQQHARQQRPMGQYQPRRPVVSTRGVSGPTVQQMWPQSQPQSAGASLGGAGTVSGTQSPQQQQVRPTAANNVRSMPLLDQNSPWTTLLASGNQVGPPAGYAQIPVSANMGTTNMNANSNAVNANAAMTVAAGSGPESGFNLGASAGSGTTLYPMQQFRGQHVADRASDQGQQQQQQQQQGQALSMAQIKMEMGEQPTGWGS
ncbi:MAG: hypothetical protein M1831_004928 [Alyxoria varia]|nr:MAG: hypothetical protein M1831_004928 [Alyxoria varia]